MTEIHTDDGARPAVMSVDWMAQRGPSLLELGYPIIPIIPGAKCPGRWRQSAGWSAYPDWSRHCSRPTKSFELSVWETWPGCGIGIAAGTIGGLDIDILDAALADRIAALAQSELGDTPAIRIGRAPKRLLVYRMATPFAKIAAHPLEFIGRGAQFVAYGIHPDTQEPYRWPFEELAEVFPTRLPEVGEAQIRAFLDKALKLVPPELRANRLPPDRSAECYLSRGNDLRGTAEATSAAVEHIPNHDWHYDDWIRIGLAIKGSVGDAGWPLFEAWSAQSAKNDPKTTARMWAGFKSHSLGFGTLWKYATDYGWNPPQEVTFNQDLADAKATGAGDALFAAITTKALEGEPTNVVSFPNGHDPEPVAAPAPPVDTAEIDAIVAEAPGALGRMTRWMVETAISPQPLLSLGGALCAYGVAAGHKYRLSGPDTRSSVYTAILADSGAGKEHPRTCISEAMKAAGLDHLLGGEDISSGASIMTAAGEQPCTLFLLDEFGHVLKAVLNPKAPHHIREIMTNFTKLWSSNTRTIKGKIYADAKARPRVDIREPCICVYGSTVPREFWQALKSGNVGDGSLARFLVFQTSENFPDPQKPQDLNERLPEIAADLKAVSAGIDSGGNLTNVGELGIYTVPVAPDAEAFDLELSDEHLAMKRHYENTAFSAIVARFREQIRRVALIAAVGDNPADPVLTAAHLRWATRLVRWSQNFMMNAAERFVADSEHEANLKEVLEAMREIAGKHGRENWMTKSAIIRKTQKLGVRDRDDCLTQLVEADQAEHREVSKVGPGRKPQLYRLR